MLIDFLLTAQIVLFLWRYNELDLKIQESECATNHLPSAISQT
jgi:hypothetical protein